MHVHTNTHSHIHTQMLTGAHMNDHTWQPEDILAYAVLKFDYQDIYISVQELQRSHADLQKVQSEVEKQRTEFDKKVMEVISLKKSHQEQEAELRYEIDRLKDQLQRTKEDFNKAQEKNKQVSFISH